jgi:hypothetical protein
MTGEETIAAPQNDARYLAGFSLMTIGKNRYIGAASVDPRIFAMISTRLLSIAAFLFAVSPALADDAIVKLPPTPMPAAGPTTTAAQEFCGDPPGKAEDLIAQYSTKAGLQKVYDTDQYLAYSDDPKNATVMYTLTKKRNPAYPAIVCRKVQHQGDNLTIVMKVICDGDKEACAKLQNDFNVMNAQMQTEVDQQIAGQKK